MKLGIESTYTLDEARSVVLGYAFDERSLRPTPVRSHKYGELPDRLRVSRWGYSTYDCVPASPGSDLTDADMLVPAGLNGEVDLKALAGMRAVAPHVNEVLRRLDDRGETPAFWELPPDELNAPKDREGVAWDLSEAWWYLMSVPRVGMTLTHKVLHHKRPRLFPLLDRLTLRWLPAEGPWGAICKDLNREPEDFEDLERWFASEAAARGTVPLTRLRLYDILLWCDASGEREDAQAAGRALRESG